jgi:aconitate hydratase
MVNAGARILESACGPCIGMGQAPGTDAVSLRTFNRNFEGRSGTKSAKVYLVSPETAAVSALNGVLTDPRENGVYQKINMPDRFTVNDNMIVPPAAPGEEVEVIRGPNIKPFPVNEPPQDEIKGTVLIKLGDNITTDDIMPSNAKLLPFRSNIPYLANYCLTPIDPEFPIRAKEQKGGFIIAGSNYGQGSSREHAALAPLQLGIKGVAAKSFARIHMANLINSGILPLVFEDEKDYELLSKDDLLFINNFKKQVGLGNIIEIIDLSNGKRINTRLDISERQKDIILAGGLIAKFRKNDTAARGK